MFSVVWIYSRNTLEIKLVIASQLYMREIYH